MHLGGSSILVTGGTGSFGQAFVKLILAQSKVRRLVVLSRGSARIAMVARSRVAAAISTLLPASAHCSIANGRSACVPTGAAQT